MSCQFWLWNIVWCLLVAAIVWFMDCLLLSLLLLFTWRRELVRVLLPNTCHRSRPKTTIFFVIVIYFEDDETVSECPGLVCRISLSKMLTVRGWLEVCWTHGLVSLITNIVGSDKLILKLSLFLSLFLSLSPCSIPHVLETSSEGSVGGEIKIGDRTSLLWHTLTWHPSHKSPHRSFTISYYK